MKDNRHAELEARAARRFRISAVLTTAMLATYFGFVLLVAYDKPALGAILTHGLSVGILLGALVIVAAWALTGVYVRLSNSHYDGDLSRLRARAKTDGEDAGGPS